MQRQSYRFLLLIGVIRVLAWRMPEDTWHGSRPGSPCGMIRTLLLREPVVSPWPLIGTWQACLEDYEAFGPPRCGVLRRGCPCLRPTLQRCVRLSGGAQHHVSRRMYRRCPPTIPGALRRDREYAVLPSPHEGEALWRGVGILAAKTSRGVFSLSAHAPPGPLTSAVPRISRPSPDLKGGWGLAPARAWFRDGSRGRHGGRLDRWTASTVYIPPRWVRDRARAIASS
jgi:hypothetical protein